MKRFTNSVLGTAGLAMLLLGGCKKDSGTTAEVDPTKPLTPFSCATPAPSTDYSLYPLGNGGSGVGDVMPYYDATSGLTYLYYLRDVYQGPTQRHPVYAYTTSNFASYVPTASGEVLSSSSAACAQDMAIGTGSVVQRNGTYYFFYSGDNANAASCNNRKQGVLLATATGPDQKYTKQTSFTTIYPPDNLGYDFNDNFRDPYVYLNTTTNQYVMLVAARKNVGNGVFKGVVAQFTSANLLNWTYQSVLYDGGFDTYFNMECPSVFKLGNTYYLMFSDQDSQRVFYRKSSSPNGPWSYPSGPNRFDGNGFYAAKVVTDRNNDSYISAWVNRLNDGTDTGGRMFGGNLVSHKLYQLPNGDLAVTIPAALKTALEAKPAGLHVNAQAGNTTTTGTNTFTLNSATGSFLNSVVFDPITAPRFKVSTTVNYSSATKDFGFMLGACDNYSGFYSLRFVPSQNRFSLDRTSRDNVTLSSTTTDVPFKLSPNTDYTVDIVEENSVVVVYLNNVAALTCRVYRAPQSSWGLFADNATATFKNVTVTTAQ
ncbi:MAG: glycoside hydrolase domain-containing protein [Janthinobacterium lividum]